MDELLTRHSAIMDRYDPDKTVDLIVDEWGTWYAVEPGTNPGFLYQQNSLRDALVAALTLHIFHQHCDRVTMSNIAQTVNVLQALILTEEGSDRMLLTPTYHVFELYKVHQDATLLPIDLRCDAYTCGELTMPGLSATASRDTGGSVHLSLCNVNPHQSAELTCDLRGMDLRSVRGRVLTAEDMTAHNTFDEPTRVCPRDFHGATIAGNQLTLTVPAKAVVVLDLNT
jgi:alpha-N-arabinofuranosidase